MSRSRLFILGLVALAFGGFLATQVYKNLQTRASATTMATCERVNLPTESVVPPPNGNWIPATSRETA